MSLQDVLSFVNIIPDQNNVNFSTDITAFITNLYNESSLIRNRFDARVESGVALNIQYVAGKAQDVKNRDFLLDFDTIQIDPDYCNNLSGLNEFGNLVPRSFEFVFTHELCHALFDTTDPSLDEINMPGFDFIGSNVRIENLVHEILGEDHRLGYFEEVTSEEITSNTSTQMSYTFGNLVDYGYINTLRFGLIDASESLNTYSNGLFVGVEIGETITAGNGRDYIWGFAGNDILNGGQGADNIFGGESDDTLEGGSEADLVYGGAGNDLIVGRVEVMPGASGIDGVTLPGFELFSSSATVQAMDGGSGADVLIYNGGDLSTRVGEINGELAIATAGAGGTDVAFGIERLVGVGRVDFSASQNGISFNWAEADEDDFGLTLAVSTGGQTLLLSGIDEIFGSAAADTMTADGDHNFLIGNDGADSLFGTEDGALFGGNGGDRLTGGLGTNLYGDAGDDTLISGGGHSGLNGGSGVDVIQAVVGDRVSGDANDRLTISGQEITGNNHVFSLWYWHGHHNYDVNRAEVFYGQPFAIFVMLSPLQPTFDGTQSSLLWEGYVVLNPSAANFESSGQLITETASCRISYRLGDFGLTLDPADINGLSVGHMLTYQGENYAPGSFPIGDQTGSIYDDEADAPEMFSDYSGVSSADLVDFFEQRSESGSSSGSGGGGSPPPAPPNILKHSTDTNGTTATYQNFDVNSYTITIDGTSINPTTVQFGIVVTQVAADVNISYGDGNNIVLKNLSLAAWQAAASQQVLGTSASEALSGTSGNDLIANGAGNDTISAGAGDDQIIYTSGNDIILGNAANAGSDTLDLRRFAAADVHFSIIGADVLITTADGTILLGAQVFRGIGDARSNIENVLFSDGTLHEADIRVRAVADQTTSGNDLIAGTGFADTISGGAGDDTITGSNGDDSFLFTSGNDLILGNDSNFGTDTVNLSQYAAADVRFSVSGTDVLITTADGSLRLQYQIRYDLADPHSNIEAVQFSDGALSEAGIRARAVADQMTAGNDSITGTTFADLLSGGAGNDTLNGGAGSDTFVFTSDDDLILGHVKNTGADRLDLSQYDASAVRFSVSGADVVITTPDGTIRLGSQVFYDLGNARSNIETITFSNGSLNEAGIRARALADQATSGADLITGTGFADLLNGGAGNDTLTGGAGADMFVFGLGAGKDRVTDFSLASDHILFSGHVFSDLTITQSGANTLVAFAGDIMTLANISATSLTAAQFDFT